MARIVGSDFQNNPTRRFIISPDNICYRIWCFFLSLLSVYTCSVTAWQWAFTRRQSLGFSRVDDVINYLFLADIFATFFVAYIDQSTHVRVDNRKKIALNYFSSMFVPDIILFCPFGMIGMRFNPSTKPHKVLMLLRFIRICRCYRLYSFYGKLKKSDLMNFTFLRTAMIIMVTFLVSHCGACVFYYIATLHNNPNGTWIGSQKTSFLQESEWTNYGLSIYWAIITLSTVGYGDLHAMTALEMGFTALFVCCSVIVLSYITGYVTNWMGPSMGKSEEYDAHRRVATSYCKRNCIPTPLRNEIYSHLLLKYTTKLPGFQNEDHNLLQTLPRAIKTRNLQCLCSNMSHSYLFEEVSTPTQFQMVQAVEFVVCPANTCVILQNEKPTCFYFVVTGSVDLIIFENGIEQVVGTIKDGNYFGESCVFANIPQMFTVTTKELTQLVKIDRATFLDILEGNTKDGLIMIKNHIKLLESLNDPFLNRGLRALEMKIVTGMLDVPISLWFAAAIKSGPLFYRLLLQHRDPNEADDKGQTPLHIVASRGDRLKVIRLCEYGADPNIRDLDGKTPIDLAANDDIKNVLADYK